MRTGKRRAFSLIEVMVVVGIIAILIVLTGVFLMRARKMGEIADSTAKMRTMGQAILLYSSDHEQQLPGPLWPGQVMLYDPAREGRLVRDLSIYLGVETNSNTYLVTQMIPLSYRRAMQGNRMEDARIYVMNSSILIDGVMKQPFGSLTPTTNRNTLKIAQIQSATEDERWLLSEADQTHPDVVTAPWKTNTPALPVHDGRRMVLKPDGAIELQIGAP